MESRALGRFEHDLLHFIAVNPNLTSRQLFERYGFDLGYTRGTIAKSLDRLVKKGVVKKNTSAPILTFASTVRPEKLDRILVESFVKNRLKGDLSPLFRYLAEATDIPKEEVQVLEGLLQQMKAKTGKV